jgi:hypothetical protein
MQRRALSLLSVIDVDFLTRESSVSGPQSSVESGLQSSSSQMLLWVFSMVEISNRGFVQVPTLVLRPASGRRKSFEASKSSYCDNNRGLNDAAEEYSVSSKY